ncbi:hypothetical protein JKF63_04825 [Porcisia hertigi]|uniref:Uncharacterized protein n=1 Tax=Porcisia hertigi TaxID=2761500 RepID=A0A836I3K7_9TRYP|nr:hypothetical protein JKF63_04825 [Porcisia hertigi]
MSGFPTSATRPAVDLSAAESGSNSNIMQTPLPPTGTTLFLREEGNCTFVSVHHQSSVTLRDLAEEFNISSVLECDAHGNVQPRAVAFDSPSDVLHSGRHYIARRDARAEAGNSYVTFRGKILVKEYELEHPTPPASCVINQVSIEGDCVDGSSLANETRSAAAITPFPNKRSVQEEMEVTGECCHLSELAARTPAPRQDHKEEDTSTISRALALSSGRKRPREDARRPGMEDPAVNEGNQQHSQSQWTGEPQLSLTARPGIEGILQEGTTVACAASILSEKPNNVQSSSDTAKTDKSVREPGQRALRFIPFSVTSLDGMETYVTLDDLQRLCQDDTTKEEAFQKRHKAATDILESARRVLFTTGEVD